MLKSLNFMHIPEWIKTERFSLGHNTVRVLRRLRLNTVCEEARCPNRALCFSKKRATFMILGRVCTRKCGFCSVNNTDTPFPVDEDEPMRILYAVREMSLRHVVITSVTRDDLEDKGASHFARVVRTLKDNIPQVSVEVLVPDFQGERELIKLVINELPDVFNHNIETVPSLYPKVRPQAQYERSLDVLRLAKEIKPDILTKSGLMLGLGETMKEVIETLTDLRLSGCDVVTIGQYLRPAKKNLPVVEYISPEIFERLRIIALEMGFRYVSSGPLVRSSMDAGLIYERSIKNEETI